MTRSGQGRRSRWSGAHVACLSACLMLVSGCMMLITDRREADVFRAQVSAFCEARAAGDQLRMADMFAPDMRDAVRMALSRGQSVQWASRPGATGCRPGRTWALGGSRQIAEVVYDGFADRFDIWRGEGYPAFSDLHYEAGEPRLSRRLGIFRNTSRVF